ncbi:MAG TPA: ATP synthase F1 subunit epsilon [Polyangiaceae bacterium]|jgi:F-type H+-transporting ATPase subunit epsilon
MAETITLEIITPDGVKLSEEVSELTAPSVEGEFGVLPGHRPLLAALKTGIVSYRKPDEKEVDRVGVGPGFAEVIDDKAVLLTDRFTTKSAVDPVRARLELKEADEALAAFDGDPQGPEFGALVSRERWAATELELYGDPPPPTVHTVQEFAAVAAVSYSEDQADDGGAEAPR